MNDETELVQAVLSGETLKKFNQIKKIKGIENKSEVLRVLITEAKLSGERT